MSRWKCLLALAGVGVLGFLAYAPALSLPFISDDYQQIELARSYGPVSGWPSLAADPLFRARSTSLVLTYWTERAFGFTPLPFNVTSLLLHVLNVWMLYALSRKLGFSRAVSLVAAGFFAVQERPHEAVMWYASIHEPLVFFFAAATLLAWLHYQQSRRPAAYLAALAGFLLALLSKESAVALVPLLVILAPQPRRAWKAAAPFAALAVVYFGLAFMNRGAHQHFNDGTFSLTAPFWIPLSVGAGRLLWFWGLAALAALLAWRDPERFRALRIAGAWILIFLLPYSFLTYMPRIPSRHTYLASAGAAWLVGLALVSFYRRLPAHRWVVYLLGAAMVLHNWGYLWFWKQAQYVARAEPTERLSELATSGSPIRVRCFPFNEGLARMVVRMRTGVDRPEAVIWESASPDFHRGCLSVDSGSIAAPRRTPSRIGRGSPRSGTDTSTSSSSSGG